VLNEAGHYDHVRHTEREQALAKWAEAHHRVISVSELVSLGYSPTEISDRVKQGRLKKLTRGVYQIGPGPLPQMGRFRAALLAAGPGAAVFGRSAAALHGVRPDGRSTVDVVTPQRRRNREDVNCHCVPLSDEDVTEVDGLKTTTLARTLLDLALTHPNHITRAMIRAERLSLFDLFAIRDAMERAPRHRGKRAVKEALIGYHPLAALTRSFAELAYLMLVTRADLPTPRVNQLVHDEEVDFHWPALHLVVEIDGPHHDTAHQRAKDHARDDLLEALGWTVHRFRDTDLKDRPGYVLAETRLAIARRRGAAA
jgi:very-short-patch-repair endonuclease